MIKGKTIGILDLGSNSIVLLVARCHADGRIEPVDEASAITRLGEGVSRDCRLAEAEMAKSVQSLKEMKQLADRHQVEDLIVVATSAVRNAINRHEFLVRCHETLGVFPLVLGGKEEAKLTYLGATYGLSGASAVLAIDVGGGSTEVACGNLDCLEDAQIIELGCVSLLRQFHPERGSWGSGRTNAAREILRQLAPVSPAFRAWMSGKEVLVLASGGTAVNYAAVLNRSMIFDRKLINSTTSTLEQLAEVSLRLFRMSLAERQCLPGLEPERAEVFPSGLLILETILRNFRCDRFSVTANGLRFGVLRHYLSRH